MSLSSLLREAYILSSPDFVNEVCAALHRDVKNFHVYGYSGVGKTVFFQWLADNFETSTYLDLKTASSELEGLALKIQESKGQVFILDHIGSEDLDSVVPFLRKNRKNIIFLLSSIGSLNLPQNTFKIGFYPMGEALASLVVEQKLFYFQNRFEVKLPDHCSEFIKANHLGIRGLIHEFLKVCEERLTQPEELQTRLEEVHSIHLKDLPVALEKGRDSHFPFGIEADVLPRVESLWNRLKPGLDQGWMSLAGDAYILHGGFDRFKLSDAERDELFQRTQDPLRQFYLLEDALKIEDFLNKNPQVSSLEFIKASSDCHKAINDTQLEELKKAPSTPLRDVRLQEHQAFPTARFNWFAGSFGKTLQPFFDSALRRGDQAYVEHFLKTLSAGPTGRSSGERLSYIKDWQAQVYLRQGNFMAAQQFWISARIGACSKRERQILLHQYLTHIAALELSDAILIFEQLLSLYPSTEETCLAHGVDRILGMDLQAAKGPVSKLEEIEAENPTSIASDYMVFLGYLEQKISSPWTYLRFQGRDSSPLLRRISPGIEFLFEEIDRRFCLCFNRNGKLWISHERTLDLEYENQKRYDLFFDFHHERYFEKELGSLKIEKSRITLLLFCLLAFFPGRRFSWAELYAAIYRKDYNPELDEGTIRMAVTRMKKSLEPADESYFGISLVNQELYLKASTRYCVIISDEEIQELHELALRLKLEPVK